MEENTTAELVSRSLHNSGYPELQSIRGIIRGGIVVLNGVASSYWMKQMAQVVVRKLPGVTRIHNEIRVASNSSAF